MSIAHWPLLGRYCQHIGVDAVQQWKKVSDSDETVRFLYSFFVWRCDIRRGKNGRTPRAFNTKALSIRSGSGGTLFSNKRQGSG